MTIRHFGIILVQTAGLCLTELTGRPFHLPAAHVNADLVVIVDLLLHVSRYARRVAIDFLENQAITQDGRICAPGYCQDQHEHA